jgi:hypothetical protein
MKNIMGEYAMKKKIALATLSVLPLAAGSVYASGQIGTVTATSLNVRSGAGTNYKVLFSVKKNEQVNITQVLGGSVVSTSPVVYVYKMKADYSHNVPVMMNEERTQILSFPDPRDLWDGEKLRLPTALVQDYWLDNKGIGVNVAFLKYTYEEYSKLSTPPSVKDMLANLLDKYPLVEIHACGHWADYTDIVSELNSKIVEGKIGK